MAAEVDKSTDVRAAATGAARPDYIGLVLGERYRLVRPLGHGGMGSVYSAEHALLGKPLAVKVLDSRYIEDHHGEERLFREARAAAAIGHQNIIDVVDVGTSPFGDPYLVMEYLEGEDLSSYGARECPLSCAAACAILGPILEALIAAHAKGIVHRDIKPANIFLVDRVGYLPVVKLIDFGIAKTLGRTGEPAITVNGALLGTPSYMSPEQARGSLDVDERADLYAVGVVFYQLLTGRLPFDGANYNETLYKIINDAPEQPDSLVADLPADAIALIRKAIAKDPADRYQSAEKMLRAMQLLWAWPEREHAMASLGSQLRLRVQAAREATIDVGPTPTTVVSPQFEGGDRREAVVEPLSTRIEGSKRPTSTKADSGIDIALSAGHVARTQASSQGRPLARPASSADGADAEPTQTPAGVTPSSAQPDPNGSRRVLLGAVGGAALVGLFLLGQPEETPKPIAAASTAESAVAPRPAEQRTITITLAGLPAGATIRLDEAVMNDNPFTLPRSDELVTVTIEKEGFEPFSTKLVPSRDVLLPVQLKPEPTVTARPAHAPRAPQRSPSPAPQPEENVIRKGGRDSLYYEKFE